MNANHCGLMATDISTKPNEDRPSSTYVPYRATKLWNEVVQVFRDGLPTGRHRHYMKSYESCFVASEAVTWLHQKLQENPNFGPQVTRAQTVQLLQKFQKAKLIADVRGPKHEKTEFADNGRLYRFVKSSPTKTEPVSKPSSRVPLAIRSSLMNSDSALSTKRHLSKPKVDLDRGHSIVCLKQENLTKLEAPKTDALQRKNKRILPKRSQSCREERQIYSTTITNPQPSEKEIEQVWKDELIDRLQTILQLKDIDEVLDTDIINVKHIIHNMTQINKNGLVTNIDKQEQLPHWIISAMRCLAYWPEKVEENLPDYPGFEQDVFKVIRDYFWDLDKPLITFQLYEVFLSVMVYADNIGKRRCPQATSVQGSPLTMPSTTSVENLLLNMTNQDNIGPDDILIFNDPDVTILPSGLTPLSGTRTLPRCCSNSGVVYSQTRMETSFGVNSNEPQTRLYQQKESLWDDCDYHNTVESEPHNSNQQLVRATSKLNQRPYSICATGQAFDLNNHSSNTHKYKSVSNMNDVTSGPGGFLNGRMNSWSSLQSNLHQDEYQHFQKLSHRYRSPHPGASHSHSQDNVTHQFTDPNCYPPPPPYTQKPPPYIAPPSYNSVHMRPPPHPLHIQQRKTNTQRQPGINMFQMDQAMSPIEVDPFDLNITQSMPSIPQLKCLLTESYRQAIDSIAPNSTPVGRSLFASSVPQNMQRSNSSPSVLTPLSRNRVYEVLQLCCLLIPPANKRKLHLLLRFMHKASNNSQLQIDSNCSMKELILETFTRCILRSEDLTDHDELMTKQIATFMMEGYVEIMKVPEYLKQQVEERINKLKKKKVTVAEFEQQRLTGSQEALSSLLEDIINNKNISQKDRKRHLKQFQKNHPEVYAKRFPNSQSEAEVFLEKPKIKPIRLSKPLLKLRNLRL